MRIAFLTNIAAQLSLVGYLSPHPLRAQEPPVASVAPPNLPPATKLEAFKPAAGSILTIGYTQLGKVSGVRVDVREMKDANGNTVRGLLVDVTESQYREERSFVDADEIPELLKGLDALLAVNSNPTRFEQFEVRYTTRGELEITAFNSSQGGIQYAVEAGRTLKAQRFLGAGDMRKFRDMVQRASANSAPTQGMQMTQPPGASPAGPSTASTNQVPPGMKWVVDQKSRKYYALDCPAGANIPAADRQYYATESSVILAGFTRGNDC
jgi:hypothetical protein